MNGLNKDRIHKSFVSIVGKEHTFACDLISPTCWFDPISGRQKAPDFMVRPGSLKQVQKIVRLANRHGVPLIPRSSRAGTSPVSEHGGILVDLSRMDKILNIDERNRAARIEPGVRWGALQAQLHKHGLRAVMPLLPHADKSALTCFLEREPVLIPKFEYSEPVLTMEVVLPNGDLFRTGSASGPAGLKKTRASLVGPYGPSAMDFFRLFQGAQGTLGIVTWINIKAEALPVNQKLFFIPCRTPEDVIQPLYRIQRRMIGYECLALNNQHLASILAKDGANGLTERKKILPAWTIMVCLGGGRRHPEKKLAYEDEALRDVARDLGVEPLEELDGLDSSFLSMLQGPWQEGSYFKHKLKGSAFDIFFITTLNRVPGCASSFFELAAKHNVNPDEIGTYIQPIEYGRACHVEFSIPFSPESSEETERLRVLAEEATDLIIGNGGFFSRLYGTWGKAAYERSNSHNQAVCKLKRILDPGGIMNTGAL